MLSSRLLWRLFAGYASIVVFTAVLLGAAVTRNVQRQLEAQIQNTLRSQVILLQDLAAPFVSADIDSAFQHRVWVLGSRSETRLTVIRADGKVIADSREDPAVMDNHRMRPEVLAALSRGEGMARRYSETVGHEMMYVAMPVTEGGSVRGYVRAALPLEAVALELAAVRQLVLGVGAASVALALLIGLLLARSFTKPLAGMTTAARAIAEGDYQQTVDIERSDEIGDLARALNTMTVRMNGQINALTTDRNKTRAILAGMVEGVIAIDRDERVVHVNSAAESILDIDLREAAGRRIWEATRVREACEALSGAMREQRMSVTEARIATPQKEQVIQLIATPLRDGAGQLDGAILVLHDVSELRKLESVRRDFIANISHELKTPLAAICGLVETLIEDRDMAQETHERFLEKVRDQASRLSNLVVDLLTISRLESDDGGLQYEPVDLRETLAESYRAQLAAAETKRLQVEAHVPDEEVVVDGDGEALRELADNLVNNAIKYTPTGGRVDIRLFVEGLNAVVEVEDTGIGIATEDQNRIFERFYRVDKARSRQLGGTGLGLSIVKHVALAHGGNVALRSAPGQGSTFRVQIPLAVRGG